MKNYVCVINEHYFQPVNNYFEHCHLFISMKIFRYKVYFESQYCSWVQMLMKKCSWIRKRSWIWNGANFKKKIMKKYSSIWRLFVKRIFQKKNHEQMLMNLKTVCEFEMSWITKKRFMKNVHQFENGSWKKIPIFLKNAQEKMFMNLETVHEFEMSCISNKIHEKNHQKVGPTQVLWASPGLVLLAPESFPMNKNFCKFSDFFEHFHFFCLCCNDQTNSPENVIKP